MFGGQNFTTNVVTFSQYHSVEDILTDSLNAKYKLYINSFNSLLAVYRHQTTDMIKPNLTCSIY